MTTTKFPQATVDETLENMRAAADQLTAERVGLAELRTEREVPRELAREMAQADADARSAMAVIPLIAIGLLLGLGSLGAVVFGLAWLGGRHWLAALEALGCLGLVALGWAGADRLARRSGR